jgi:hypothetical protein
MDTLLFWHFRSRAINSFIHCNPMVYFIHPPMFSEPF